MKVKFKTSKILLLLLLIPFISIILVIIFRNVYFPTNEEILESAKDAKAYFSKAEYTIKNSKGEYKEEANIYYCKEQGMRIEFGQERVKIYKDGYISMNYNGDKYKLNGDFDEVYTLAFISNLLSNEVKDIKEESEEWGDIKYLVVEISLPFKNNHMNSAKLYINKVDKSPIVTKIYDINNDEKLTIVYKDFRYINKIDKELF
jgi:outer membrane lipoprotein-sorting protein